MRTVVIVLTAEVRESNRAKAQKEEELVARKSLVMDDSMDRAIRDLVEPLRRSSESDATKFLISIGLDVIEAVNEGKCVKFGDDEYNPLLKKR